MSAENEQRFFDALKRITMYDSVARLRRASDDDYGLPFEEALEYAYENIKAEAERAIRGKRRPKVKAPQTDTDGATEHAGRNAALESQQAGRDKG